MNITTLRNIIIMPVILINIIAVSLSVGSSTNIHFLPSINVFQDRLFESYQFQIILLGKHIIILLLPFGHPPKTSIS